MTQFTKRKKTAYMQPSFFSYYQLLTLHLLSVVGMII